MPQNKISVNLLYRAASPGAHSIEKVFAVIRNAFPAESTPTEIHMPRLGAKAGALWANLRFAWSLRPQGIIHITGDVHYALLALIGCPTVLTIHDLVLLEQKQGLAYLPAWLFWFQLPVLIASRVVCITETTRERLLEKVWCPRKKTAVIYDPLPPEYGSQPKAWPEGTVRLLFIGTKTTKNLLRLTEALDGIPGVELRIVGKLSREQEDFLQKHKVPYSAVFNISETEIRKEYENADAVLFPTLFEGFGMPLIEGQAMARPVIASKIPPLTEIASPDSFCAVDPYDVQSIRDGIQKVLHEPDYRKRLVVCGLENVKRFDASKIAQQYQKLYSEIKDFC